MGASKDDFMLMRQEDADIKAGISFEHLIDAKKANLNKAITTIVGEVSGGNYDSLKGLILALKGKALFTDLEKALRPLAENDYLDKLEKGYCAHDTKIEQAATKTDYNYSVCGSPIFERLQANFDEAKKLLDEQKDLLKAIKSPMEMIDEETGESFRCLPPNKLQKEGLKLTIL